MSTVSGLYTTTQAASLGLIQGTGQVQTTSASQALAQGQGTDQANFSQGAQLMNKLSQLQSSDPSKFKAAATEISDKLAEEAKNSSDPGATKMLTDLSNKFAQAAKTGEMPDMRPSGSDHPQSGGSGGNSSSSKFGGHGNAEATFATVNSIISNALSEASSGTSSCDDTSTSSSDTTTSEAA